MKLSQNEIQNRLDKLQNWSLDQNKIIRKYKCVNFIKAIEFINLIAERAEAIDHHPDILISNYNQVTIILTTHSANGLSENDFNLAQEIDATFNSQSDKK